MESSSSSIASRGYEDGRRRQSSATGSRQSIGRGAGAPGARVRVMARVRPFVGIEEEEREPVMRTVGVTEVEVLCEPRAQLCDVTPRNRRRTTGNIGGSAATRSEKALAEAARTYGLADSGTTFPQQQSFKTLERRTFTFDQVFDASVSDDQVFAELQDELNAAVDGEAVCILAYGATGSGKTHTVSNLAERTARELDRQAECLEQDGLRLELMVQIVEIYNEQFRDLLVQDGTHQSHEPPRLKMSAPSASATLQGASHRTIRRDGQHGIMRSLQAALRFGQAQRSTSATAVHGRSSRSHLVMMLYLVTKDPNTGVNRRVGRLSLVDLAGSERIKSTEVTGDRLKEAQHINRSLSALADVMVAKEKGVPHVPYRNSKLTHMLQDALGGQPNSRTVIIVALPPTRTALGETIHSLQFSSRLLSLAVQKSSTSQWLLDQNGKVRDEESIHLEEELNRLRAENAQLRSCLQERDQKMEDLQIKLEMVLGVQTINAIEDQANQATHGLEDLHVSRTKHAPPSPVQEVESSLEKSSGEVIFDKSSVFEKSVCDEEDGQQPLPEPEAELGSSEANLPVAARRRGLDESPSLASLDGWTLPVQTEEMAAESLLEKLDQSAGPEGSEDPASATAVWKWNDPKDLSAVLNASVASPARAGGRRRSSVGSQKEESSSPMAVGGITWQESHLVEEGCGVQIIDMSQDCTKTTIDLSTEEYRGACFEVQPSAGTKKQRKIKRSQGRSASPRCTNDSRSDELNASSRRTRSCSARTREFVVEALTPDRAAKIEEAMANAVRPAWCVHNSPMRVDMSPPISPALLLKLPDDGVEGDSLAGDVSCISLSSTEGDICERLKKTLHIVQPPPNAQLQQYHPRPLQVPPQQAQIPQQQPQQPRLRIGTAAPPVQAPVTRLTSGPTSSGRNSQAAAPRVNAPSSVAQVQGTCHQRAASASKEMHQSGWSGVRVPPMHRLASPGATADRSRCAPGPAKGGGRSASPPFHPQARTQLSPGPHSARGASKAVASSNYQQPTASSRAATPRVTASAVSPRPTSRPPQRQQVYGGMVHRGQSGTLGLRLGAR